MNIESQEIGVTGFSELIVVGPIAITRVVAPTKRFVSLDPFDGLAVESDTGKPNDFSIVPGQQLFPKP